MPNYTPIDSTESFKPDKVQMQNLREKLATSIAVRQWLIHTYESITPFGLGSFFIRTIKILQQYYNIKPFNPALTSLEEAVVLGYIQKLGDPAQRGANPRRQIKSADRESINADLKLN